MSAANIGATVRMLLSSAGIKDRNGIAIGETALDFRRPGCRRARPHRSLGIGAFPYTSEMVLSPGILFTLGRGSEGGAAPFLVCSGLIVVAVLACYVYSKWAKQKQQVENQNIEAARLREQQRQRIEVLWMRKAVWWSKQLRTDPADGLFTDLARYRAEALAAIGNVSRRPALQDPANSPIDDLIPNLDYWERKARKILAETSPEASRSKTRRKKQ